MKEAIKFMVRGLTPRDKFGRTQYAACCVVWLMVLLISVYQPMMLAVAGFTLLFPWVMYVVIAGISRLFR